MNDSELLNWMRRLKDEIGIADIYHAQREADSYFDQEKITYESATYAKEEDRANVMAQITCCFFEKANYKGQCWPMTCRSNKDMSTASKDFLQIKVKSVLVAPGCVIYLFSNSWFTGEKCLLTEDCADLDLILSGKGISSVNSFVILTDQSQPAENPCCFYIRDMVYRGYLAAGSAFNDNTPHHTPYHTWDTHKWIFEKVPENLCGGSKETYYWVKNRKFNKYLMLGNFMNRVGCGTISKETAKQCRGTMWRICPEMLEDGRRCLRFTCENRLSLSAKTDYKGDQKDVLILQENQNIPIQRWMIEPAPCGVESEEFPDFSHFPDFFYEIL